MPARMPDADVAALQQRLIEMELEMSSLRGGNSKPRRQGRWRGERLELHEHQGQSEFDDADRQRRTQAQIHGKFQAAALDHAGLDLNVSSLRGGLRLAPVMCNLLKGSFQKMAGCTSVRWP